MKMLNNEIANSLQEKYGEENFKMYCKMQITRSELELADEKSRKPMHIESTLDGNYELFFWQSKLKQLNN